MSADLTDRIEQAVDLAKSAHARVDGHEELCALRYNNLLNNISRIENILKWAGSLIVTILIAVLGWLIVAQINNNEEEKKALEKQIEILEKNQFQPHLP